MLNQYVRSGVGELDQERLPRLIELKYHGVHDAMEELGSAGEIAALFSGFQKHLYEPEVAA